MDSQPTVPPTPTQPAVPIIPTPAKSKLPMILVSLVVLLLVGGGGIFLGKQISKPATNLTPTPVVVNPTTTVDPTANWKTYTNSLEGLSFKYPPDWSYQQPGEGCGPVWFSPNSDKVWFTLCGPQTGIDSSAENLATHEISKDVTLVKREVIQVNGHNTLRQVTNYPGGSSISVYIENVLWQATYPGTNGNPGYTSTEKGTLPFYLYIHDQSAATNSTAIFDQILSTFKFTNTNGPSSEKTYADPNFKITVTYPTTWQVTTGKDTLDVPYFVLRRIGAKVPEVYIGGASIYSTSAGVCLNSNCKPVDNLNLTINGKAVTIAQKQEVNSNGSLGAFLFQSNFDQNLKANISGFSEPVSPAITSKYTSDLDRQEIVQILSSIKY